MKLAGDDGEVVFRPSITRASLPLAITAVGLPLLAAGLVAVGVLDWWTVPTASPARCSGSPPAS